MLGRRSPFVEVDGVPMRACACGQLFAVELNRRGLPTTRRLCDRCRELHARRAADLDIPAGTPRCGDCGALVGLEYGTVTHLDDGGRCPGCAEWERKRARRQRERRRGYRFRGGLSFPSRVPLWIALRKPETGENAERPPERWVDGVEGILAAHNISWDTILGERRFAALVAARAELAAYLRAEGWTVEAIGRRLHRHHVTVLYLLDTWDIARGRPAGRAGIKGRRRTGAVEVLRALAELEGRG